MKTGAAKRKEAERRANKKQRQQGKKRKGKGKNANNHQARILGNEGNSGADRQLLGEASEEIDGDGCPASLEARRDVSNDREELSGVGEQSIPPLQYVKTMSYSTHLTHKSPSLGGR